MKTLRTDLQIPKNPLLVTTDRGLPTEFAVVGAGTIGPDIAYYLKSAMPSGRLFLLDVADEALKRAEKRLSDYVKRAVEKKTLTDEKAQAVLANITYTSDYNAVRACNLVIEAATENLELKKKIFSALEGIVSERALLTSNTSSIPADRIFGHLKHPERSTVTHFFAPAWRNPAVEVVQWQGVSRETLAYLYWLFGATGKVPALTDNVISFMYNRIFENWCNEAAHLLDRATAAEINAVAEEFVAAGPFTVLNMANGNPLVHEANTRKLEEGEHYRPAKILLSVERWSLPKSGVMAPVAPEVRDTIKDRLLGLLFSQTVDILDRRIGTSADLNLGCVVGLGFRKGTLDIMGELGEAEVGRIEKRFSVERPGFPQAKRPLQEYQRFSRHLLVDNIEGVKVITIRRPQAMNAVNGDILRELRAIITEHAKDPGVRGFILTGCGTQAFSAGMDIGNFPATLGKRDAALRLARESCEQLAFLDSLGKPVVAAVNGLALGGGLELAMRCHGLVAVRSASFQFPEITLGILPGMGGCAVPYRKWPAGASLFNDMICLGRKISAGEAASVGLVQAVADDYAGMIRAAVEAVGALQAGTSKILEGCVRVPAIEVPEVPQAGGMLLSKEAVVLAAATIKRAADAQSFAEALEENYAGAGAIACLDAAREGITAFLEKRKPTFTR